MTAYWRGPAELTAIQDRLLPGDCFVAAIRRGETLVTDAEVYGVVREVVGDEVRAEVYRRGMPGQQFTVMKRHVVPIAAWEFDKARQLGWVGESVLENVTLGALLGGPVGE